MKVYLKTLTIDINGLFVWTLGSVIPVIQLIWALKKLFVSYLSITWIITRFLQFYCVIMSVDQYWVLSTYPAEKTRSRSLQSLLHFKLNRGEPPLLTYFVGWQGDQICCYQICGFISFLICLINYVWWRRWQRSEFTPEPEWLGWESWRPE